MPGIFISYRRQDTSYETTMIFQSLEARFGSGVVFMDVDGIPAGDDFRQCLSDAVNGCDVVLVIIGRDWLVDRDGNRRLDDPNDLVRIEIEAGFEHGIRVIPVLVHGTPMPCAGDLPASIGDLAYRHALEVRPGNDFRTDLGRLIGELERSVSRRQRPPGPSKREVSATVEPEGGVAGPPAKPGPVITNSIGMKLVQIPAGESWLGSDQADPDARDDEKPPHQVWITRHFYLGIHQVTQQQYRRVMGHNPSHFTGEPERPVDSVSWDDAQEFCRRLSSLDEEKAAGRVYRLPTEAEWEYACRAAGASRYGFGDSTEQLGDYAWIAGNSAGATHPVGRKKPNAWGVHDMHGNVWEWCADGYDANYYATCPPEDPAGPDSASERVLRGGAWSSWPVYARSAHRYRSTPENRDHNYGFRVVATE